MAKPTILSVGVTAEQEASIRHNMRVAGETNLSAHLRDVYFSKDRGNDALIGEMRREIGALTDAVGVICNNTVTHIHRELIVQCIAPQC